MRWAGLGPPHIPKCCVGLVSSPLEAEARLEDLAVPCSGRMLTLKSSSWLRALMRSSSSWMGRGRSVISWRHALEERRQRGDVVSKPE